MAGAAGAKNSYRNGVLVGNWNEDRWGADLVKKVEAFNPVTEISTYHTTHGRDPTAYFEPTKPSVPGFDSLDGHLMMAHAPSATEIAMRREPADRYLTIAQASVAGLKTDDAIKGKMDAPGEFSRTTKIHSKARLESTSNLQQATGIDGWDTDIRRVPKTSMTVTPHYGIVEAKGVAPMKPSASSHYRSSQEADASATAALAQSVEAPSPGTHGRKRLRDVSRTEADAIAEVEGEAVARTHVKRAARGAAAADAAPFPALRSRELWWRMRATQERDREASSCYAEGRTDAASLSPLLLLPLVTWISADKPQLQDVKPELLKSRGSENLAAPEISTSADVAVPDPDSTLSEESSRELTRNNSAFSVNELSTLEASQITTVAAPSSSQPYAGPVHGTAEKPRTASALTGPSSGITSAAGRLASVSLLSEISPIKPEPLVDYGCNVMTTYVDDIYEHHRREEQLRKPKPDYMTQHKHINERMRAILIDWLVEVVNKYKQQPETLYLTVSLVDRYLERQQVQRNRLQLVGITALLIASKYEQTFRYEVRVEDMVYICDRAYTANDIRECESTILRTLEFRIGLPSPYVFAVRMLKVADADLRTAQLTLFICERTLQEYGCLQWPYSQLASAAVNIALRTMRPECANVWTWTLERTSGYSADALRDCILALEGILQCTRATLNAVRKKYSQVRYGSVSTGYIRLLSGALVTLPGLPVPASGAAHVTPSAGGTAIPVPGGPHTPVNPISTSTLPPGPPRAFCGLK